jgi:hypothetical protein
MNLNISVANVNYYQDVLGHVGGRANVVLEPAVDHALARIDHKHAAQLPVNARQTPSDTCQLQINVIQGIALDAVLSVRAPLASRACVSQHVLAERVLDAVLAVHRIVDLLVRVDEERAWERVLFQERLGHLWRAVSNGHQSDAAAVRRQSLGPLLLLSIVTISLAPLFYQ